MRKFTLFFIFAALYATFDEAICVVCMDRYPEFTLEPCKHTCICKPCSRKMAEKKDHFCPLCREEIKKKRPCSEQLMRDIRKKLLKESLKLDRISFFKKWKSLLDARQKLWREKGREDKWGDSLIDIIKVGLELSSRIEQMNKLMEQVRLVLKIVQGEKRQKWKARYAEMLKRWQLNNEFFDANYNLVVSRLKQSIFCESESEAEEYASKVIDDVERFSSNFNLVVSHLKQSRVWDLDSEAQEYVDKVIDEGKQFSATYNLILSNLKKLTFCESESQANKYASKEIDDAM